MGVATPENKVRNDAIYKDFTGGLNLIQLVHKYQLTSTRIYQIVKRAKARLGIDKTIK